MSEGGGSIDPDKLELLERRLAEAVSRGVQSQLFKNYFAMGAVAVTILGFVGWNIVDAATESMTDHIQEEYLDQIQEKIDAANVSIANIDAMLARATTAYSDVDKLTARANESVGRINALAEAAEPKIARVEEFADRVDDLLAKSMNLEGRLAASETAAMQVDEIVRKFPELANQVAALAEVVAKSTAPVPIVGSTPTAVQRVAAAEQAAAVQQVVESSTTLGETATQAIASIDEAKGQTIAFLQYNGMSRETAQKIAEALGSKGFIIPGIENVAMPDAGLSEVRYYWETDRSRAEELVAIVNAAILNLGVPLKPATLNELTDWAKRKPAEGTVELWLGQPTTTSAE